MVRLCGVGVLSPPGAEGAKMRCAWESCVVIGESVCPTLDNPIRGYGPGVCMSCRV